MMNTKAMMNSSFPTLAVLLLSLSTAWTKPDNNGTVNVADTGNGVRGTCDAGTIDLELLDTNMLRVDVRPGNKTSPRTLVIDPSLKMPAFSGATVLNDAETIDLELLDTNMLRVDVRP